MKKQIKLILIVLVLFLLYGVIAYHTSTSNGLNQPPFTSFNTNKTGVSLLYDTLKYLQYPMDITFTKISEDTGLSDIQIVLEPELRHFSEHDMDEILSWVYRGGRLVFLTDSGDMDIEYYMEDYPVAENGPFRIYRHGMGEVLTGSAHDVSNDVLKDQRFGGYAIQQILDYWDSEKIYFNEYYHGFQQNPSLWKVLPAGFKTIVYQIILVAAAAVWLLGKRFGKPVPYYEEIEREENEYVKALSLLYTKAGLGDAIIEHYYRHFISCSARYFNLSPQSTRDNILTLWESKNFAHMEALQDVHSFIVHEGRFNTKKRSDQKQFQRTIKNINLLTAQIKINYMLFS